MTTKTIVRGEDSKEFEDSHKFEWMCELLDDAGEDYEVLEDE